MNNRIFERLRSKTASYNRNTAPKKTGAIRLDLLKLNVKRLLVTLAVLVLVIPAIPISAITYPEVLSDYIDVHFELTEETPVSLTFEVTVVNELGYDLEGLPLEILIDGAPVETITLTKHEKYGYKVKEPVYSEVQKSYASKYGIYELGDASKDNANTFADYDKDGKILYQGSYETFDKTKLTWYWTQSEQTSEKTVDKVEDVKTSVKVKEKDKKTETVLLDLPSKDDTKTGYGAGVSFYTVTIDTGLLKTTSGWGSAGVMTWRITGYDYKDLENSSWWATNWEYKRRITMDATSIADTLEEFPITVFLNDGNFNFDNCQIDGDDFRFVDADDNNLAYEIDLSSDFTDTAIFYVNVPEIVGGTDDGYIDMYYGNPTASSGENITGTWNSAFVFVSHMNDNPLDSSQILDSTSNANHGTKGAGAAPTEVDGLVGKAQSFDKADLEDITIVLPDIQNITLETAFKSLEAEEAHDYILEVGQSPATGIQSRLIDNYVRWRTSGGGYTNYNLFDSISTATDYILAFTYDLTGQELKGYKDGTLIETNNSITLFADFGEDAHLGQAGGTYSSKLNSETRISNTARGAGWISYTNSTLRDEVLTVGDEVWADIPQAPIDLTYTTDGNNVILDWTKGLRADTTVIVRGENGYPLTSTDGVVVYDGAGITATDYGVNSELRELYYRAWSYNDWGYSVEYAEAKKGVLMTELFMVLGLTTFALWRKEIWVYVPAIIALSLFGMRWAETDMMFGLPFFALALFMIVKLGWVMFQRRA